MARGAADGAAGLTSLAALRKEAAGGTTAPKVMDLPTQVPVFVAPTGDAPQPANVMPLPGMLASPAAQGEHHGAFSDTFSADTEARTVSTVAKGGEEEETAAFTPDEARKVTFGGEMLCSWSGKVSVHELDYEHLTESHPLALGRFAVDTASDGSAATPIGQVTSPLSVRKFKSTASCRVHNAIRNAEGQAVHRTTTGGATIALSPKQQFARTPKRARVESWPSMSGRCELRGEQSVAINRVSRCLEDEYSLEHELGRGSFGHVFRAVRLSDGLAVAVKTVADSDDDDYLQHEMDITKRMNHPNICWLHAIFRTQQVVHLVMELCLGGDLFDKIAQGKFFSERVIAVYLWQMVSGIAYCHYNCFCHRDIKPENYLLDTNRADASLKLIDFGLARHFEPGTAMTSSVGSIYYISPEVVRGQYSEKRDIWSIGITAFMMSTMRVPYDGCTDEELAREISAGSLDYMPLDARFSGSHPLRKLIMRLLTVNEQQRPSAKDLSHDPWLRREGTRELGRRCRCPLFG